MMYNEISRRIIEWQQNCPNGPIYNDLDAFIRFRAQVSFHHYHPTTGPYPEFNQRLIIWLDNLIDIDEQRRLFELVPRIYFFGKEEIDVLYRAAHQEIVINWLIDLYNIDITSNNVESEVKKAIQSTLFSSVTDSGRISDYCHINGIQGPRYRPEWLTWAKYGKMAVKDLLEDNDIKQVVMVEDFICTGSQFLGSDVEKDSPIIECMKTLGDKYKFLIVPLITCKDGIENITDKLRKNQCTWVQCSAVFVLNEKCFIRENYNSSIFSRMSQDEIEFHIAIHAIIKKAGLQIPFRYGPFGYGIKHGEGMGSLVVLYTNCPDNSLAIIHEQIGTWKPLFLRHPREAL